MIDTKPCPGAARHIFMIPGHIIPMAMRWLHGAGRPGYSARDCVVQWGDASGTHNFAIFASVTRTCGLNVNRTVALQKCEAQFNRAFHMKASKFLSFTISGQDSISITQQSLHPKIRLT